MGRELQKKKRRSSRPAVKQPSSTKSKRILNPLGNDTIARNWDKNLTTTQNYRRLGLVGRLKAPTGGAEPGKGLTKVKDKDANRPDPFAIALASETVVTEVRVERDENGKIVRVLGGSSSRRDNPLNDPLNALETDSEAEDDGFGEEGEEWDGFEDTNVVKELEAEANLPREKKPRTQSHREREWLQSLVERHGDDTRAMSRDKKLNPMQQTEADIRSRLRKWKGSA